MTTVEKTILVSLVGILAISATAQPALQPCQQPHLKAEKVIIVHGSHSPAVVERPSAAEFTELETPDIDGVHHPTRESLTVDAQAAESFAPERSGYLTDRFNTFLTEAEAEQLTGRPGEWAPTYWEIFPDPTTGKLRLRFNADPVPTEILIADAQGRPLRRMQLDDFKGSYTGEIDLGGFSAGLLVLTISQNGQSRRRVISMPAGN